MFLLGGAESHDLGSEDFEFPCVDTVAALVPVKSDTRSE